jgi:hypothetical protein
MGLASAIPRSGQRSEIMNQPATPLVAEAPTFPRSVPEQMETTRRAVAAGEGKHIQDVVHPALWERLGPLRTLRRRSGLREIA